MSSRNEIISPKSIIRILTRFVLLILLINPKKILKSSSIIFGYLVSRILGSKKYKELFFEKLKSMICLGLPINESYIFFNIPNFGRLVVPSDSGWIVGEIFVGEVYDRFFKLASDSVVLDVGAHVGIFSLKIAKKVQRGLVLAIEPHPKNFNFLVQNIRNNQLSNVIPLNLGLGKRSVRKRLYLTDKTYSASTIHHTNNWLDIPVETLDNVIRKLNLERVDFIKIDVEGAELEILKGGEEILKQRSLKLSIAAYHFPSEIPRVKEFLKMRGFIIWTSKPYLYAIRT